LLQEHALAKMEGPKPHPPETPPPSKLLLLKPKVEFLADSEARKVQQRAVAAQFLGAFGQNQPGQSSQSNFVPQTSPKSSFALQRIGTKPKSKAKPSIRFVPLMPRAKKRMRPAKAIY
jgi:hypothetical protein